ncbi:cytochrome P450 [Diaporthe sp. PMI_573]|nr:cytochrome P450 [Diaporthaceae sp. PMI_573]
MISLELLHRQSVHSLRRNVRTRNLDRRIEVFENLLQSRLMRPQFTRDQVSDLKLEQQHLQNMMSALHDRLQPDGWTNQVDLQVLFFRLTLDSATEFLLGEGQIALATRVRLGLLYRICNSASFRESVRQCNMFMDHYVKRALNKDLREKSSEKSGKQKYVFLEALAEQTQDPIELRSQLMHILLAGRDTTASMLSWLFYLLARDPARYKKLRDIVIEEFGTFSRPKEITFARLKGCQYLQHCNNETLRLYPVVPINTRWAYNDTVLPTGGGPNGTDPVFVPKNSAVDYCVYVIQRRKDIWGPDADKFRPERWEGRKVGWEFLPFNGGPRICLGQQFALTESSYVTVRLLQRFDAIENLDRDPVPKQHLTLTSCSANGVKVRMHAAAES